MSPSTRWLLAMAGGVVAIVVVSVVVAVATRGDVELFPEDTPEGTVQRYLQALVAGDLSTAYEYLSVAFQDECDYRSFRDFARRREGDDRRYVLEDVETLNGEVEVSVRVTRFSADPPFGGRESSSTQRYILALEDGAWRFTGDLWRFGGCPKRAPVPAATGAAG